jgi:type II secretory pathway pseudopilin PulG
MYIQDYKMHKHNSGFGILESMLVLAMLAIITLSIVWFNSRDAAKKDAKILSAQTEAFTKAYAKYMKIKEVYALLVQQTQAGPVTLSPSSLYSVSAWPSDLTTQNMYRQTPCVTIVRNSSTGGLEALMYYVGGSNQQSALALDIVRSASIWLGGKGGILLNGAIRGNAGWSVDNGSEFLSGASQCGGALANNSLAVNLDLVLDWNQDLHPLYSILRGTDRTLGQLSLPGRLKNANTSKSNIYLEPTAGIILDNSDPANQVKLAVQYSGSGSGASTLGLGNNASNKLIGDALQPNLFFGAGQGCASDEEGKTVADQGLRGDIAGVLSRGTLICTHSDVLCGAVGGYCYLTSIPNQITFQNTTKGIQDPAGKFICPQAVPFAMGVKTGFLSVGQIYVIDNKDGGSPNGITAKLNKSGVFTRILTCPTGGCNPGIRTDYTSGIIDGIGELLSVDLGTITGKPVGTTIPGGAPPDYTIIQGTMSGYSTPIGYSVITIPGPDSCKKVCANLGQSLGNGWQLLGTQRQNRGEDKVNIDNQDLGCACERTDFSGEYPDNYNGIAAVIESAVPAIIISATCSNMPVYDKQNKQ